MSGRSLEAKEEEEERDRKMDDDQPLFGGKGREGGRPEEAEASDLHYTKAVWFRRDC